MGFMNVIVANASALNAMDANTTQYLRRQSKDLSRSHPSQLAVYIIDPTKDMELPCASSMPKAEGMRSSVLAWSEQQQISTVCTHDVGQYVKVTLSTAGLGEADLGLRNLQIESREGGTHMTWPP